MEKLVSPLKILRNTVSFVYESERLGQRFVALRESRKLTQQDLADSLGLSLNTLEDWENGIVEPVLTGAEIKRLSKVLEISLFQLFEILEIKPFREIYPVFNRRSTDREN
jgi:transcriptional regulator with XRE-family HTH domain